MADKTSTLRVQLIDQLSANARKAAASIVGIGTAVDKTSGKRIKGGIFDPAALSNLRQTLSFQERMGRQRQAQGQAEVASRMRVLQLEREIAAVATKRHAAIVKASQEAAKSARHNSLLARSGRALEAGGAIGAGVVAGGAVLGRPLKQAMTYDQQLSYMATTMAGGGSKADMTAAKKKISDSVDKALKSGGGTREGVAGALNELIASGQFGERGALDALPSVAKAAHATGSAPLDLARSAIAMRNAGVAVEDIGRGFDAMTKGGQLGSFEITDMARWLPQQLALGRGAGMSGLGGVRELAALNQLMMTTAGTKDEGGNNLVNLLAKLNSRELQGTMQENIKPRKGDPVEKSKKKKDKGASFFDWQGYMIQQKERGVSPIEAMGNLLERQLAEDERYQGIKKKIDGAKTDTERHGLMQEAANIAEGAEVGKILADRQALLGLLAVLYGKDKKKKLDAEIKNSGGTVDKNSEFIRDETWSKAQDLKGNIDRANEDAYNQVSGPLGSVISGLNGLAERLPGLTAALYGASAALTAIAAGRIVGGLLTGHAAGGAAAGAAGAAASSVPRFASSATPRMFGSGDLARAQAAGRTGLGAGAAGGSLMSKVGAGLKGGLINGALYGAGTYAIDKLLDALPKPAYPPGYDPKIEASKGLLDRIQELVGMKERYQPPAGWRESAAMQRRIDTKWGEGTTGSNPPNVGSGTPAAPSQRIDDVFSQAKMSDPNQLAGSMQAAMANMQAALAAGFSQALVQADAFMAQMNAKLSTTLGPTIRPKLDMGAMRGVHADTGVD